MGRKRPPSDPAPETNTGKRRAKVRETDGESISSNIPRRQAPSGEPAASNSTASSTNSTSVSAVSTPQAVAASDTHENQSQARPPRDRIRSGVQNPLVTCFVPLPCKVCCLRGKCFLLPAPGRVEVFVDFFRMIGASQGTSIQFTTVPVNSNFFGPDPRDAEYQREQAALRARHKADVAKRETKALLDGFKTETDIDEAKVSDLKYILDTSCVDHSECVEKKDLAEKVVAVWKDSGHPAAAEDNEVSQDGKCKICFDEPVNTVFVGCGHLISCTTCAQKVEECPLCRKAIKDRIRVFRA